MQLSNTSNIAFTGKIIQFFNNPDQIKQISENFEQLSPVEQRKFNDNFTKMKPELEEILPRDVDATLVFNDQKWFLSLNDKDVTTFSAQFKEARTLVDKVKEHLGIPVEPAKQEAPEKQGLLSGISKIFKKD